MKRALGIVAFMLVGLGVGSAGAAQPQPVAPPPPEIKLPARIQAVCTKATGDLAFMCGEYERLYRDSEVRKTQETKKLQQLTRGGVVETLQ